MTLNDTLEQLVKQGVRLALDGDRLAVSAPRGVLTEQLRAAIRQHRDAIVQFLRERREESERAAVRIGRTDRGAPIPASYAQHRLWLVEQLGSDMPVYNMYFATGLVGDLDVDALRGAVEDLTARQEVLRTSLVETDTGLWQVVDDSCAPAFHVHHTDAASAHERLREVVSTRFDLSTAPLVRFDLIAAGKRRWILAVTQHHVISDGWSTGLMRSELSELYAARVQGRAPTLPDVTVQYADYAVWEREWLGSGLAERQRAFWHRTLADLPAPIDLTPARQRPAVQSYRGSGLAFRFGPAEVAKARELSAATGGTLYSTLVGVYGFLLARMSRTDDVIVGSPLASRPYPALENTFGLFFNSITVRSKIDDSRTVREHLRATRRTVLDAFANRDLPFDQVVSAVAPERSSSHSPVFQVIFILQSYPDEPLSLPGVAIEPVGAPIYSAQYDLMFKLQEDESGFKGQLIYNTTLLTESDARRVVDWYRHLLTAMHDGLDKPIGALPLLDKQNADTIDGWNAATARPVPAEAVHHKILRTLRIEPDRTAVVFRGDRMSRGELAERSRAIAAGLCAAGLRPGQRVGLLVSRSPDLVAVLLGSMFAGLTYVPLDGRAPQDRTGHMLATAKCDAVVTSADYADRCPDFPGIRLAVDALVATPPTDVPVAATDAAYVLFTSGSTGRAKGVQVSHANLTNFFVAMDLAVPLPDPAVWLAVTTATFDISVVELLWTLGRGATVVLAENTETTARSTTAPSLPTQLIVDEGVTALQATPTFLRSVLRLPGAEAALARLRLLLVGGEPLDLTLARRLKAIGVPTVLNMYGPTETTVWSTSWLIPDDPAEVLVGSPLGNTCVHVVDTVLNPLPVGMYGEVLIGGAGVAQGYAGEPGLTAERFVRLPGVCAAGVVYRTGDIGRWLPDGSIELVGRLDNQVKINGFRVELEEVEHAVNSLPGIASAAVRMQPGGGGTVLVAHCVTEPGSPLDASVLAAGLAEILPDHMIPAAFNEIAVLPTSSSGKVDRRALPEISLARRTPTPTAAAPDGLIGRLLAAWRLVLDEPGLGADDDFFLCGGNSILVARLLTEVRTVHPDARIVDLFRYPTARAYAAHLTKTADREVPAPDRRALRRRRQQAARSAYERAAAAADRRLESQ